MKKIKALILRTAGTNCDRETLFAFRAAGAEADAVHVNALAKDKSVLARYHILAIPGGFTYGDDVASGKVLANELRSNLEKEISRFVSSGKLVIGICNGFQVLIKMGLLPGGEGRITYDVTATLGLNDSGRFEDRWVHLTKGNAPNGRHVCVWTRDLPETTYIPVAHAEGKFMPRNEKALRELIKNGQVVFRYTNGLGKATEYPGNPNGSVDDIAGVCDVSGRILGLMPHPERHISYLQHPNWRRFGERARRDLGAGLRVFENGVNFARKNL